MGWSTGARRGVVAGLALLVILGAAACGSGSSTTGTGGSTTTTAAPAGGSGVGASELDGRVFASTSITGRQLAPGSDVTLTFTGGQLSANGGCNTLVGAYTFAGGTLKFVDEPQSTMIGCDADLMAQDTWLSEWLRAGVTATSAGGQLTLDGAGVTIVLQAGSAGGPSGEAGSPEGTWALDTITSGTSASNVPAGVPTPTLQLAGSEVQVFTGCNRGGGTVQVGEATITFSPMRLTMMACDGAAGTVEATVTKVLDGTVPFTVQGARLTTGPEGAALVWRRV